MPRLDRLAPTLACLLAACASQPRVNAPATALPAIATAAAGPVCRVGPQGGPPDAPRVADRGIGGTGAPATGATRLADRGIGGTGIIGVVTGFASICLGGQDVGYDPAVPVLLDDRPAAVSDLRAGQLAAVDASGRPDPRGIGLVARRVLVRHEVSGPIEAVLPASAAGPGGTILYRVAGQSVAARATTLGDSGLRVGDWIAVSGFRDTLGTIQATRLDRRPSGDVRVHGTLIRDRGTWRIGLLELRLPPGIGVPPGIEAVVDGRYADGVLYADSVVPDPWTLRSGPFDPNTHILVFETFDTVAAGHIILGRNQASAPGIFQRTTVELNRRPDGALQPALRAPALGSPSSPSPPPGQAARTDGRRFDPAPVPNRAADIARGTPEAAPDRPGRGGASERAGAERPAAAAGGGERKR